MVSCTYSGVPLSKYTVGVLRSNNGVEESQLSTNGRGVEFSSSPEWMAPLGSFTAEFRDKSSRVRSYCSGLREARPWSAFLVVSLGVQYTNTPGTSTLVSGVQAKNARVLQVWIRAGQLSWLLLLEVRVQPLLHPVLPVHPFLTRRLIVRYSLSFSPPNGQIEEPHFSQSK